MQISEIEPYSCPTSRSERIVPLVFLYEFQLIVDLLLPLVLFGALHLQHVNHLIAHIVLIVFNGLVAVCVELDHTEWAATAEDEERNDDPEKDFVELVLEYFDHLQVTRPVAYHCNVMVLQGAALADQSAL